MGIGMVAAGANEASKLSTILGAVVTAILGAQRAHSFICALADQAANLQTDVVNNLITAAVTATSLKISAS